MLVLAPLGIGVDMRKVSMPPGPGIIGEMRNMSEPSPRCPRCGEALCKGLSNVGGGQRAWTNPREWKKIWICDCCHYEESREDEEHWA
jgi:hypothetical protein